jgi:hypothetical protein
MSYRIEARVADDIRQIILDENRRHTDNLDREFKGRGGIVRLKSRDID